MSGAFTPARLFQSASQRSSPCPCIPLPHVRTEWGSRTPPRARIREPVAPTHPPCCRSTGAPHRVHHLPPSAVSFRRRPCPAVATTAAPNSSTPCDPPASPRLPAVPFPRPPSAAAPPGAALPRRCLPPQRHRPQRPVRRRRIALATGRAPPPPTARSEGRWRRRWRPQRPWRP